MKLVGGCFYERTLQFWLLSIVIADVLPDALQFAEDA